MSDRAARSWAGRGGARRRSSEAVRLRVGDHESRAVARFEPDGRRDLDPARFELFRACSERELRTATSQAGDVHFDLLPPGTPRRRQVECRGLERSGRVELGERRPVEPQAQ